MRILYIVTKSEIGGAQTHIMHLVRHMKSLGHEVAVLAFPGGWLAQEVISVGADFFPNTFFSNSINPFRVFRAIKKIQEVLKKFKPDIVSLHSSAAGFMGRMAIRNSIPTIFTAHSWAFTEGAPMLRRYMALLAERITARYAKKIICVSEYDRKLALKYRIAPTDKLLTIYNGVPIQVRSNQNNHKQISLITVGRLAYPKEYKLLLDSIFELRITDDVSLTIIGDGPDYSKIIDYIARHNAKEYITVLSHVEPIEIPYKLSCADIFILLSKHEGFPMSILESMANRLPVVASRVGGIPEQVTKDSGILVNNQKNNVVSVLRDLIKNPKRMRELGDGAYNRVCNNFSLKKFLIETESVYQKIVS